MPDEPILREMARQFGVPTPHRLRPRDGFHDIKFTTIRDVLAI